MDWGRNDDAGNDTDDRIGNSSSNLDETVEDALLPEDGKNATPSFELATSMIGDEVMVYERGTVLRFEGRCGYMGDMMGRRWVLRGLVVLRVLRVERKTKIRLVSIDHLKHLPWLCSKTC